MSSSTTIFEFQRVAKGYGTASVLAGCDWRLREREHTALLGPSGSGKSTVLRLLAGLETPTEGNILMNGTLASSPGRIRVQPHRRHLAMVFQDLGLWPALNVFDNVLLALDGRREPLATLRGLATNALELCGIGVLATRMPGTLSGGEQQRVALARALAPEPDFLLLDEPFAGLDLATKARLLGDLKHLLAERRVTVCLVTHDPGEAFSLCTHGAVLEQGRVSEHGPWADVLRTPHSALLRAFQAAFRHHQADGTAPEPSS